MPKSKSKKNPYGLTETDKKILISKPKRLQYLYKIKNRENKTTTFKPNKAQIHYHKNKHTFNIILKSRRLGFTTYGCIDMLDDVIFALPHPKLSKGHIDALLIAHTKDDMYKLFDEKIAFAWEHFPPNLKKILDVDTERSNMLKFGFGKSLDAPEGSDAQDYSSISVALSGRSGGYAKIHISEFGKICAKYPEKAREILSGAIPAVPLGGEVTIESTAEGDTSYFHDMFWEAWNRDPNQKLGPTDYKAHFYNWTWDTEEIDRYKNLYTPLPIEKLPQYFRDYQKKHSLTDIQINYLHTKWLAIGKDYTLLKREYPFTPEEAFESNSQRVFNPEKLDYQLALLKKAQNSTPPLTPINKGAWTLIKEPHPTHRYVIGADPSEGVGGDHAAATILDISTPKPEVVAIFMDKYTSPDQFAYELKNQGLYYNTAFVGVERNNHGHATLLRLRDIYPEAQIYKEVRQTHSTDKDTDKYGWATNIATKSQMVYGFENLLNDDAIILNNQHLIDEVRTYPRDNISQIRKKSEQTRHWDLATSMFIACQMIPYGARHANVKTYIAQQPTKGYNSNNPQLQGVSRQASYITNPNRFNGI